MNEKHKEVELKKLAEKCKVCGKEHAYYANLVKGFVCRAHLREAILNFGMQIGKVAENLSPQ